MGKIYENITGALGLGNFMGNMYKVISGEISKEKYRSKHKFFQKRATDCYIQNQFYNYIDNEDNRSFFTELKQTYEKERYLNLKNFEIRNALSKLRLSSNKLAVVTGKWYKINKENRLCNFCNLNAIEDEFHFLIDHLIHKKLRKSPCKSIQDMEHIDLSRGNITKKLRELVSNGSLLSLYVLDEFVQTTMESRENPQNRAFINLTSRKKKSQSLTIFFTYFGLYLFFTYLIRVVVDFFFIRLLYTCSKIYEKA